MWFKVDDKLWGHPKWLAVSPRARGLWVTAGSWCAAHEYDGHIPRHVLPLLAGTPRDATELVSAGLWRDADDGWMFHDWAQCQPTRAQRDESREAAKERMRAARERRALQRSSVDVRANTERSSGSVTSTPTRPDPTRPELPTEVPEEGASRPPRRKAARPLPPDWHPNDRHAQLAFQRRLNLDREAAAFRDSAQAKDRRYADWDAAFRTWLSNGYAKPDPSLDPRPEWMRQ